MVNLRRQHSGASSTFVFFEISQYESRIVIGAQVKLLLLYLVHDCDPKRKRSQQKKIVDQQS